MCFLKLVCVYDGSGRQEEAKGITKITRINKPKI